MSLTDLATLLESTAKELRKHAGELDDAPFLKSAGTYLKSSETFASKLQAVLKGRDPDSIELFAELESVFRESSDPRAALVNFSKKILGKKVPVGTRVDLRAYRKKVAKKICEDGKLPLARLMLKNAARPSVLDFTSTDETALLVQIRRLGSLDAGQLEVESEQLLKKTVLLKRLAQAGKLKVTSESNPATLVKQLIKLGKRFHENRSI